MVPCCFDVDLGIRSDDINFASDVLILHLYFPEGLKRAVDVIFVEIALRDESDVRLILL